MATPFSNKCEILSQLWYTFKDDDDFAQFFKYNDIGLPLSYFVVAGLVTDISDKGNEYIEETWSFFESAFELNPDIEYDSLEDIFDILESRKEG